MIERVKQFTGRYLGVQRPQRLDDGRARHLAGGVAPPSRRRPRAASALHRPRPHCPDGAGRYRTAPRSGPQACPEHPACGALPGQIADEEGSELAAGRRLGLDLSPVRGQFRRGLRGWQRAYGADRGQRHAQAAQPGHQPGLLELSRGIEAVLRHRVDPDRAQQPQLVVQAKRLARKPRRPGKSPAGHQLHSCPPHTGQVTQRNQAGPGPRGKVKSWSRNSLDHGICGWPSQPDTPPAAPLPVVARALLARPSAFSPDRRGVSTFVSLRSAQARAGRPGASSGAGCAAPVR